MPSPSDDPSHELDQIAIIGMAGRFPGAPDVGTFWRNLAEGRDTVSRLTEEEMLASGVAPEELGDPRYVPAKGVLADADRFDAGFFDYSPREAELLDPQHRVFLEVAFEALQAAGIDPSTFEGRIGVFAGSSLNSYLLMNVMGNRRLYASTGPYRTLLAGDKDFLVTRVAYKLGLRGPAVTVQTACSTSLTAVHLASQSLLNGECDIALAGGVSVSVPLSGGYVHEQGGIMSARGRCRAFDAEADGTVAGNGAGVVVLRPLGDAREAGDRVDAVILGSAINNDGSQKVGYTAPSVEGQAEVIAEALAVAGVEPDTIEYVEAHGTGTALGDPIEIAALSRAYRESTDRRGYCAIGSAKSSVGHLDAAAGVTALIKAVLTLRHEAIPPAPGFTGPHPGLDIDSTPFFVNDRLRPWPRRDTPRRAAVSAFGIGGTNAHLVLEEAPDQPSSPDSGATHHLLPLSARSVTALVEGAARLADHLQAHPEQGLEEIAGTLTHRRQSFRQRAALVCADREEAVSALRRLTAADVVPAGEHAPVAFLFPGQGSQYAGMTRELYAHHTVFAEEFDRCAELFRPHLDDDLRALILGDEPGRETADARLAMTEVAQPALFTVEYALARLWESWGIRPRAMAGHSLGEWTAACLAGVVSLPDAVRIVAARGRLMQRMPRGTMLSVVLPAAETERLLEDPRLCVAAANSTALSVVSGPAEAIASLRERLVARGVGCRPLHTSHAFHSPAMAGAVEPFVAELRHIALRPPAIPFCSNVTGTWITEDQAVSPAYWGRQLLEPVRFADALHLLLDEPDTVLLEVGPGTTLTGLARAHEAWREDRAAIASVRHPGQEADDREVLLRAVGGLWSAGVPVDWTTVLGPARHQAVRLPGYAFQRQRYWIDPDPRDEAPEDTEAVGINAPGERFYTQGWSRLPLTAAHETTGRTAWAVLGAELPLGRELVAGLGAAGDTVVPVAAGTVAEQRADGSWTVDPADREHLAQLLKHLDGTGADAVRLVHLWSTADEPAGALDGPALDRARRTGLDSLIAVGQAVHEQSPAAPVTLDVLCRGVFQVTGDEVLEPQHATLLGPCTVIPQEVPGTGCRVLDITGTDPRAPRRPALRAVLDLLGRPVTDRELALRGRHLWARRMEPARLGAAPAGHVTVRDGGVYLITGGLGGVGLALAEELARGAEGVTLGLLGRSAFPEQDDWERWLTEHDDQDPVSIRIRRLRALTEAGARVVPLRADVTDAAQTGRAVAGLRERYGALRGVIHAAGLPSRGMIADKTREDVDEILAAKTRGTLVLAEVCAGDELDFLVLCSSLTALLGGPGQSDYAAANAFLDAYAIARHQDGAPVLSVAWDTWNGVGMAAGIGARLGTGDGEPAGHPLLRLVQDTEERRVYRTTLTTRHWILDDHRIMGNGLVPGTTYLELARAAVAAQAGDRLIELRDVLFAAPVVVPDGASRDVYTTIEPEGDQLRFSVRSRPGGPDAGWQEHATGTIVLAERAEEPRADLDALREQVAATEVLEDGDEIKRRFGIDKIEQGGPLQFAFGPRWNCLRRIEAADRRLMVTLRLDEEFHSDLADYPLHPALLDVAGASARLRAQDVFYLPFTYRSLRIHAPLTPTIHCHVELRHPAGSAETLTCDTSVYDPDGRLLVRIEDFTIKRINDLDGLHRQVEQALAEAGHPTDAPERDTPAGVLALLAEGMEPAEGRDAFARILAARELPAHLAVARRDLPAVIGLARTLTPQSTATELARLAPLGGSHPRPDLDTPYEAPRTPQEEAIAAIWQEVLGVDRVGVHDDFFALGGHSLAAVQIGAKLQSRFGSQLELREFFERPTVARTAELMAAEEPGQTSPQRSPQAIPTLSRHVPAAGDESITIDDLAELSDEEVEARLRELLAEDQQETE